MEDFTPRFSVKTKDGSSPSGKRRVFFFSQPEKFNETLDKICEDLWKTSNCAVYYVDPTVDFAPSAFTLELSRMNLFVLGVTTKLLTDDGNTVKALFDLAKSAHVPFLPIVLEENMVEIYSQSALGKLQYLDATITDSKNHEIVYDKKLSVYLSATLTDDETAKRVRDAFDAYIFLSYRKKDRAYADKLMRIIHKNPLFRDVAIWFDEYLTPGEDFNNSIQEALDKSDLFALLVTPNLINESNYVKEVEYPAAKQAGKKIVAGEAIKTDPEELRKQYEGLPECADIESEELYRLLLQALENITDRENDSDPEHLFLIGLAYLDGIDVEVDKVTGLHLLGRAAEAGLPEAVEKIRQVCQNEIDSSFWGTATAGLEELTFDLLNNLDRLSDEPQGWGEVYSDYTLFLYEGCRDILGAKDPVTVKLLGMLIIKEHISGKKEREEEHRKLFLQFCYEIFSEEVARRVAEEDLGRLDFPDALTTLAECYDDLDLTPHKSAPLAAELYEHMAKMSAAIEGPESETSLSLMKEAADRYGKFGPYEKQAELTELRYVFACRAHGAGNTVPSTILENLLEIYEKAYSLTTKREKYEKLYKQVVALQGNASEVAFWVRRQHAFTFKEEGDYETSARLCEGLYRDLFNTNRMKDMLSLHGAIFLIYRKLYSTMAETLLKMYELCLSVNGEKHPVTIQQMEMLACELAKQGQSATAVTLLEQVYDLRREVGKPDDPALAKTVQNLASAYEQNGMPEKAKELLSRE